MDDYNNETQNLEIHSKSVQTRSLVFLDKQVNEVGHFATRPPQSSFHFDNYNLVSRSIKLVIPARHECCSSPRGNVADKGDRGTDSPRSSNL